MINLIKHWNDFFFDTSSQVKNVTGEVESSCVCQAFRGLEDDSEVENSAEEAEPRNVRLLLPLISSNHPFS
ncbi:MAG TPA: hypothetical protein VGO47_02240 [Chlamydiales bacterium]|nr:hypothetical protein [Chlamydiales bacterium]